MWFVARETHSLGCVDCDTGIRTTKTRSRYASLAAVLSVQARVKVVWQATTAYARLGAKDRRLLNVFLYFIHIFHSPQVVNEFSPLLLACFTINSVY